MKKEAERRNIFERYIGEVARASAGITGEDAERIYKALFEQAKIKTAQADVELDEEGKVVKRDPGMERLDRDDNVVIVEERQSLIAGGDDETGDELFEDAAAPVKKSKKRRQRSRSTD
jgi:hypothetical protein